MQRASPSHLSHERRASSASWSRGVARWSLWLGALSLTLPATVAAFSAPSVYGGDAADGGGGGRWFTGSPAEGYGCSECHTDVGGGRSYPMKIRGVPFKGYDQGRAYGIILDWVEFEQRWRELRPDPSIAPAVGEAPAVGMLAEFVPESGQASGVVEIDANVTEGPQLCEKRRPTSKPRLGASLYRVRPGVDPFEVPADENGIMRCEANRLGQRCIIAMSSCGAHEVRFTWRPPDAGAPGPIWFSAGLVTTERLTGTPEGDGVYEFSGPMVPSGSPSDSYEQVLEGAPCAVVGGVGHGGGRGLPWALPLALLWLRRRRRAVAPVGHRLLPLTCALLLASCVLERADQERTPNPASGLYTPGSTLGAGDPSDLVPPLGALGDRCALAPPPDDLPATPGELSLSYVTQTVMAQYAPANATAVWIENEAQQYIATLEVNAQLRLPGLRCFQLRACQDERGPDVITSASREDHSRPHENLSWGGTDYQGRPAPDGNYTLFIEVTETDKADGDCLEFPFFKGAEPYTQDLFVDDGVGVMSGTLSWTPDAGGGF